MPKCPSTNLAIFYLLHFSPLARLLSGFLWLSATSTPPQLPRSLAFCDPHHTE